MRHHPQVERAVDSFAEIMANYEADVISWALIRANPKSDVAAVSEALGRMRKTKDRVYEHVRHWAQRAYNAEYAVLLQSERRPSLGGDPEKAIQAFFDNYVESKKP